MNFANVNDAPVITTAASVSVLENTKTVTALTATDPDSSTLTYSIVGGADAGLFAIGPGNVLAFLTAPDYEHTSDFNHDGVYNVTVQVSDGSSTDTQAISVTVANVSPETLAGTSGDDLFLASADREAFSGLAGSDTVSYAAHGAVTASLSTPSINTGDANGDTYSSIENLTGSASNDKLTGDGNANVLEGGPGADKLDGGNGSDTASYAHATSGITADLSNPKSNTGEATGDSYTSIENLLGSSVQRYSYRRQLQ